MRCPNCGYHSFDGLDNCKNCGNDLTAHRQRFSNRGYSTPVAGAAVAATVSVTTTAAITTAVEAEPEEDPERQDGEIDFGFDILEPELPEFPAQPEPSNPPEAAEPDNWGAADFTGGEIDDPSLIDFSTGDPLDFDNPFATEEDPSFTAGEAPAEKELPALDDRFDF